jgi:hypothetical protein
MHRSLHEGGAKGGAAVAPALRRALGVSFLFAAALAPAPVLADARPGAVIVAYRSHAECVDAARASKRAMSDDREAALARRAFLDEGYDGEVFYISMGFDHRRSVVRLERTRAIWLCAGPVLRQTIHVSDWR